jgi:hypothetical protein
MKFLSIVALVWLFSLASVAQEDTIIVPAKAQPPADSVKTTTKRNEIGLNIGPMLLVALGAAPYSQPLLGITYKRVIGKWAFRTNFTMRIYDDPPAGEQIVTVDSLYRVRTNSMKHAYYTVRAGMEYRIQLKTRCWLVAGVDLQGRLLQTSRRIYQTNYAITSIINPGTADVHYQTGSGSTSTLAEEDSREQLAGLGLTAGLMIPVGKRIWILGQCRFDSFYGPGQRTFKDNVAGTTNKYKYNSFYFDVEGALAEVYLFFRF